MKYRIRIQLTALAIAMLTMSAAAQSKQDTEKVTSLDSTVIALAEIWSLDQGVRNDVSLYLENSREFNLRIDSICFDKAIECIRHFGWVTDLGKYNSTHGYLLQALTAVMLHNPHRLMDGDVYSLLRTEAEAGRLHPEALALFLDKYYVTYQKRSLYGSDFRKFLQRPALNPEDRPLSDSLRRDIGLSPLPDSLFRQP